ncbi:MAG: prephenate dehydratase domain-containing protein [Clostridia bacterium]|nr:prephenate dehydratase domain-containing protein [Clostridia bacterium]
MNELEQLRQNIDAIDRQLLPLFLERMELCSKVADYKRSVGMPVLDASRERQVLENKLKLLEELGRDGDMKQEVYEFFNTIMSISRVRQTRELSGQEHRVRIDDLLKQAKPRIQDPVICYFGSQGSYSEEAAISYFGESSNRFSAKTFAEAFASLKAGKANYLVLPIENSSTGTIAEVMELLLAHGCYIVGEEKIAIRHCLLGVKGATLGDVKTVYSHEQGILQCGDFLHGLGDVHCEEYYSTALSAQAVAEKQDKSLAAIAAKRNAELLGLEVLAENINNNESNTTRFAVIAEQPEVEGNCNKVSIAFTLPHESGQLPRLLACFAQAGLNLLKLESRPIVNKPFEYMFLADYTGNLLETSVREVTNSVIEGTQEFTWLGNYKGKESEE